MSESYIVNPAAVGDPNQTPVVYLGAALARLMGRCEAPASSREDGQCGGVNGYHQDDCERQP